MKRYLTAAVCAVCLFAPKLAMATSASSSMPYSPGLTILKSSITGEVSYVLAIICILGAGAFYLMGHGGMDGLFMKVMGVLIVICIITGSTAFMTSVSATGAMIG